MGKPRNTRKYPTYPEIPEIPGNTRKKKRYPEIPDRIFWHSYPTRTRPATRYFVQYPTRPDTEKPYPLGTDHLVPVGLISRMRWQGGTPLVAYTSRFVSFSNSICVLLGIQLLVVDILSSDFCLPFWIHLSVNTYKNTSKHIHVRSSRNICLDVMTSKRTM